MTLEISTDKGVNYRNRLQLTLKRNLTDIKEISEENDLTIRKTIKQSDLVRIEIIKKFIKTEVDTSGGHSKIDDISQEEKEKIAKETIKLKKKTIKEVIPELYPLIGLISVVLHIDQIKQSNYQPWDVVSLSESKVLKYYKHDRDKLVEFSKNSFLRVYPKGTRIDSSNYDPVKSWICGGQLVSLNLQSLEDDFTLLNHVFFRINNESGYVLKPSYLRSKSVEKKEYTNPAFSLEFKVLSGIMLQKCMRDQSEELYITVKVIGSFEDDENQKLTTASVKQNFLHPLFQKNSIKFSIFEENLSFLLIKMYDNKGHVLARSIIPIMCLNEGYRNVILYDSHCQEIEHSILIIYNKKY